MKSNKGVVAAGHTLTAQAAAAISTSGGGIGAGMRRRLSGFARTLRDNGFKLGLSETRDALAVLASPVATRRSLLKPALRALFAGSFSARRFSNSFRRASICGGERSGGGLNGGSVGTGSFDGFGPW